MPKIGDVVYIKKEFDRVYREWRLVGETSRSWLMLPSSKKNDWQLEYLDRYAVKFPKNGKGYVFGIERDVQLSNWAVDNCYRIGTTVNSLQDPNLLLTIARMIGYEKLPEEKQNATT